MKRLISFLLSILTIISLCAFTVGAEETKENGALYAAVINYDNNDLSTISTSDGDIRFVWEKLVADNGDESQFYRTEISGEGNYSVTIDASKINFQGNAVNSFVIVTDADLSKLSVTPLLKNGGQGNASELVGYKGSGYYKFDSACDIDGVEITVNEAGLGYYLTKVFFCANDYSAKFMVDNAVLPTSAVTKRPVINTITRSTAINLSKVSKDDLYHDFNETKWPTIIVDENDKLYVGGSGCRKGHGDPFGATVMTTSEDGGKTYSTPKQIYNTIMDDRDVGLTYLGNGKMLAVNFTEPGVIFSSNGASVYIISRKYSADWEAEAWTKDGLPVGGVNGTYLNVIDYIIETDPDYELGNHSFVFKSEDYGKTWNVKPYSLKGTEGVDYTTDMRKMVENYQINEPGTIAPLSTPHGPITLSDGTVMWVGSAAGTTEEYESSRMCAFVSKDEGETWEFRGMLPTNCNYHKGDFSEADTCETKDGVLVCVLRSFEPFTSRSFDKGATWTTPQYSRSTSEPDKENMTEISHGVTALPNGDVVLASARRANPQCILIYISEDNGRTWSRSAALPGTSTNADMGYPSTACLSDGTLVTVYYLNGEILSVSWTYDNFEFPETPNTWGEDSNGRFFLDENGKLVVKEWANDSKGWCYFDADGYQVVSQSAKDGKKYYLLGEDGYRVTKKGWNKAGANWYYVEGADGALKLNCWMKDSKGWCFLSPTGVMLTNRVVKDTVGYCLVDGSGYWVTSAGWRKVGSDWYYVQKGGYLKTNGWMKDSKGWCFLGSNGAMLTNRSIQDSKGYCLVDVSGYWVTSKGWHLADGEWYYVQQGGYLKTEGWMNDSKGWCYLDKEGVMLKDIAVKDSKGWCILTKEGYWQTTPGSYAVTSSYGGGLAKGTYTVKKGGYVDVSSKK